MVLFYFFLFILNIIFLKKKGSLNLTKIIINRNLLQILTNEPDEFIFELLKEGIPSFFVR